MMNREPAVLVAALAAIAQGIFIFVTQDPGAGVEWLTPFITVIVGFIVRSQVVPVEKIRNAGLSPVEIDEKADDPRIPRNDF